MGHERPTVPTCGVAPDESITVKSPLTMSAVVKVTTPASWLAEKFRDKILLLDIPWTVPLNIKSSIVNDPLAAKPKPETPA